MKTLDDLRLEINQIDEEMKRLFLKRMHVSLQIGIYKKAHNLPILDEKREAQLIQDAHKSLESSVYEVQYIDFLKTVIKLSKDVQK